jgi:hypothetical protein
VRYSCGGRQLVWVIGHLAVQMHLIIHVHLAGLGRLWTVESIFFVKTGTASS